jgi:Fe-S-cluster containining protein
MLCEENPFTESGPFFNSGTKCCTYHPDLVNYLVGHSLSDQSAEGAEGRRRLQQKIAQRSLITPLGIGALWKQELESPAANDFLFGRSVQRRCPYYQTENGQCSIWRFRESVCSTWFCQHSAGDDGRQFWSALQDYLEDLENLLSRAALGQIAPHLLEASEEAWKERLTLSAKESEQPPSQSHYRKLWQDFVGREEALYRQCYEHAQSLSESDIEKLLGPVGRDCLRNLHALYDEIQAPNLPSQFKLNPELEVVKRDQTGVYIRSYSEFDALYLDRATFDGLQSSGSALEIHARTIDPGLREKLWQFRVFIDA